MSRALFAPMTLILACVGPTKGTHIDTGEKSDPDNDPDTDADAAIELVEGHWTSTDWGEMYLRIQSDDSLRGVYTYYDGRVVADFAAGQLDGWWSESPDREPPDAGLVEWDLLVEDDGTKRMEGRWATGDGTLDNEWPLEWVDDMIPADIEALFANDDEFVDGR